jgi:hypothetical protein
VEPSFYEIRVTDEQGIGLGGLTVVFALPDRAAAAVTDAGGVARLEGPAGVGGVRLDPEGARAALAWRWAGPVLHQPAPPQGDLVRRKDCESATAWTPIRSGARHTLVFRPFLRRIEIPGDAFEPGESFFFPSGFRALRAIGEALAASPSRQAAIFAQAEARGDELEAKRLSEERAAAVYGILAHRGEVWEDLWHRAQWKLKPRVLHVLLEAAGCRPDPRFARPAIEKFQARHPHLRPDGVAGPETRAALFLAYFRAALEVPVAPERIVAPPAALAPYVGCGDWNPLAADRALAVNRRVDVFVFDPVAAPEPPCRAGDLAACRTVEIAPEERGEGLLGGFRCRALREAFDLARAAEKPPGGAGGPYEVAFEMRCERTREPLAATEFTIEAYVRGEGQTVIARGLTDAAGLARVEVPEPGGYTVRPVYRVRSAPEEQPAPDHRAPSPRDMTPAPFPVAHALAAAAPAAPARPPRRAEPAAPAAPPRAAALEPAPEFGDEDE